MSKVTALVFFIWYMYSCYSVSLTKINIRMERDTVLYTTDSL